MTGVSASLEALTNDRLLRRNVVLNMAGWALPAVAALISIPLIARGLGPARFGLVALTWAAVGVFSIFDFGLGRVLTRLVAERLAADRKQDLRELVWSANWLLLGLTTLLAIVGVALSPWIVSAFLHVPGELHAEAVGVVQLLAVSIPPLAHGVALRGVLEAGQRFKRINQIRIPLGVASYAGPLIAIPLGGDARIAVGMIVLSRVAYWLAHFPFLKDIRQELSRPHRPTAAATRELMHVGGWITVSNIVSPIIVQGDRVVIAAMFPIAVSGWYGAASEVALKQLLFSAAMAPVLFSALSATFSSAPSRAVELSEQAARVTLLVLLPVAVGLIVLADPGLRIWLGPAYDPAAGTVLRWLALAVYVNTLAQIPYFLLQSGLNARAVGIVHLVELPIFFAALFFAAPRYGAEGVAFVWFARMAIDAAILWTIVYLEMPLVRPAARRVMQLAAGCGVLVGVAMVVGARLS